MRYALLQQTLEQTITRADLEEASVVAPSVARADCARLHRELFGIVVNNLEETEARALQAELARRGFPTELVAEDHLPQLPAARRTPGMSIEPAGLVCLDHYGNREVFPWDQFVFAAAGFLLHLQNRPERVMEWQIDAGPRGSVSRRVGFSTVSTWKNEPEFRVEFFFAGNIGRWQCVVTETALARFNDRPVRLRDRDALRAMLQQLQQLPPDRTNLGIKKAAAGEVFTYPSERAFEEEIVWSLYRLSRSAPAA